MLLAAGAIAAWAQSSLEMLQRDLDEMKTEHEEMTAKNFAAFLSALQNAAETPDAAEKLYLQAGGTAPKAAEVRTEYEHETPTEASARLTIDRNEEASFSGALQLHCALMRYAAMFVTQPQAAGLNDEWLAWLKTAAQVYPQLAVVTTDTRGDPASDDASRHSHHRHSDPPEPANPPPASPAPVDLASQIRNLSVKTSPISSFLGFHHWGKSDEGAWKVADLPEFYRTQILEPLRKTPNADTLAAWDVYMAMMNADQPDAKTWTDVDYPKLLFDKDVDDFASAPDTEKLQTLIGIMKAHPDHPLQDEWLGRMKALIQGYRQQRSGGSAAATTVPEPVPVQPDSGNEAPITATAVVSPATNSAPAR
jgi:hypothetical protein